LITIGIKYVSTYNVFESYCIINYIFLDWGELSYFEIKEMMGC
jgi:hypothetical protein